MLFSGFSHTIFALTILNINVQVISEYWTLLPLIWLMTFSESKFIFSAGRTTVNCFYYREKTQEVVYLHTMAIFSQFYIYKSIHIDTHICMYCVHVDMCVLMYTCTHMGKQVYVYTYIYIYLYAYVCLYVCRHTDLYTHYYPSFSKQEKYIYTYTNITPIILSRNYFV